jgi:hypothetical protein
MVHGWHEVILMWGRLYVIPASRGLRAAAPHRQPDPRFASKLEYGADAKRAQYAIIPNPAIVISTRLKWGP